MSNLSIFAKDFDPHIRKRGEDYFNGDRVEVISLIVDREVFFKVYGTRIYEVRLRLNHKYQLVSTCTCPYFEKGFECKHTWAAILKANEREFFSQNISPRDVTPATDLLPSRQMTLSQLLPKQIQDGLAPPLPLWKNKFLELKKLSDKNRKSKAQPINYSQPSATPVRIGFFVIDFEQDTSEKKWILRFYSKERKKSGELGALKNCSVTQDQIVLYEDALDRRVLWAILGMSPAKSHRPYYYGSEPKNDFAYLQPQVMDTQLTELSATQKLLMLTGDLGFRPVKFSADQLKIKLSLFDSADGYTLKGSLTNSIKTLSISSSQTYISPYLLDGSDLVGTNFESHEEWYFLFKKDPEIFIPRDEVKGFLDFCFQSTHFPEIAFPESLGLKNQEQYSKVRLVLDTSPEVSGIFGQVCFEYGEEFVAFSDARSRVYQASTGTIFQRKADSEAAEFQKLIEFAESPNRFQSDFIPISEDKLALVVERAFQAGWEVVAFKKKVNASKDFTAVISSGIDWFDLQVEFEFGNGFKLSLPHLLQNLKSGQRFIALADGTTGIIREEWIKKFGDMARAGLAEGDGIRLSKIQALFYGARLTEDKNFKADRKFKTFQRIIQDMNDIREVELDSRFKGKLRGYQKKGLSWLSLMAKHEIGSVLADDMGLGKTIQVLAALAKQNKPHNKSQALILAPKSLVYNWIAEAKKFTPHLRVHDYTGIDRAERINEFEGAHVIVTTYQTFRNDIEKFQKIEFDYFILDEAHYVKNAESQAHLACKLIKAKKKIALTGTPVENSLKDLFSILSIVTPGLISESLADKYSNEMDPEAIQSLAKSLRPFILRRTKDEVLKDLPKKSVQILYCELSAPERQKYNELKNYYWKNLSGKIEKKGFKRSKIEILEALLRLRQASCHPGLLNSDLAQGSSAKFDMLLEQLETVIADGHKALIFSQFTSLLKLLEKSLKSRKIQYEYLDGKTNKRADRVKNFQENENIQAFLISLKAGGVGLNLTSADYVFILDPWWNPAAESQAIDRAHRIGQKKKVFAYKLIAKDTVEEKILALQDKKRALASAVVSSEKSLFKGLKMDDLRELFL